MSCRSFGYPTPIASPETAGPPGRFPSCAAMRRQAREALQGRQRLDSAASPTTVRRAAARLSRPRSAGGTSRRRVGRSSGLSSARRPLPPTQLSGGRRPTRDGVVSSRSAARFRTFGQCSGACLRWDAGMGTALPPCERLRGLLAQDPGARRQLVSSRRRAPRVCRGPLRPRSRRQSPSPATARHAPTTSVRRLQRAERPWAVGTDPVLRTPA